MPELAEFPGCFYSRQVPMHLGIFVGGRSRRAGGFPKGRTVVAPNGLSIVEQLVSAGRALELDPLLVGDAAPYADLVVEVPRIADRPPGIGPLGGLRALLQAGGPAIAIACDMPFVTSDALRALIEFESDAPIVSPRRGGRYEPFFARYDAVRLVPILDRAIAEGTRSLQDFFSMVEVDALPLTPSIDQALVDWDTIP